MSEDEVEEPASTSKDKIKCKHDEPTEILNKIKKGIALSDSDLGKIHKKYVEEAKQQGGGLGIPREILEAKSFQELIQIGSLDNIPEGPCLKTPATSALRIVNHMRKKQRPVKQEEPCGEPEVFMPCEPSPLEMPKEEGFKKCQLSRMEVEHFYRLGTYTENLWKTNCLTDLCIEVGGETFAVHRAVVTCYSPYLKRKFLQCKNPTSIRLIRLMGIDPEALEILLQYMYTGFFNPPSGKFYEVLVAATKLQMSEVIQRSLQCLNSEDAADLTRHLFIFNVAKKMNLQEKYAYTFAILTNRFEETVLLDKFVQLDVETLCELLSCDAIGARSEVIVFMAALRWLDYDYPLKKPHEVTVMKCVRFSQMTLEEVIACFNPPLRPEVIENPKVRTLILCGLCYITAKNRGQEANFKELEQPKRTLLIQGEPLELWECGTSSNDPQFEAICVKKPPSKPLKKCGPDIDKVMSEDGTVVCRLHSHTHPFLVAPSDETVLMYPCVPKLISCEPDTQDCSLQYKDCELAIERIYLNSQVIFNEMLASDRSMMVVGGLCSQALGLSSVLGQHSLHYDTVLDEWAHWMELPEPRHHHSAVVHNRCLYLIGGFDSSVTVKKAFVPKSSVLRYDMVKKSWDRLAHLQMPRAFHGSAVIGDRIYTVGGQGTHSMLATVEYYTFPAKPGLLSSWRQMNQGLCCPRMAMGVASCHNQLWVIGGLIKPPRETSYYLVSEVECYSPQTGCWTRSTPPLPRPVCFMSVAFHDRHLYIIGGLSQPCQQTGQLVSIEDILHYDDNSNRWIKSSPLKTPRHAAASVFIGDLLYVLGGMSTRTMSTLADVEVLHVQKKGWRRCQPLPCPLVGHSAIPGRWAQ